MVWKRGMCAVCSCIFIICIGILFVCDILFDFSFTSLEVKQADGMFVVSDKNDVIFDTVPRYLLDGYNIKTENGYMIFKLDNNGVVLLGNDSELVIKENKGKLELELEKGFLFYPYRGYGDNKSNRGYITGIRG